MYHPYVEKQDIIDYLEHLRKDNKEPYTVLEDEIGNLIIIRIDKISDKNKIMWCVEGYYVMQNYKKSSVSTNKFRFLNNAVEFAIQCLGGRENIYDWR
jgi:uncharacterized membrane protein (UPF0182 family)